MTDVIMQVYDFQKRQIEFWLHAEEPILLGAISFTSIDLLEPENLKEMMLMTLGPKVTSILQDISFKRKYTNRDYDIVKEVALEFNLRALQKKIDDAVEQIIKEVNTMAYSVIELSGDAEAHTQIINAAVKEGFKLIAVHGGFAYLEEIAE